MAEVADINCNTPILGFGVPSNYARKRRVWNLLARGEEDEGGNRTNTFAITAAELNCEQMMDQ